MVTQSDSGTGQVESCACERVTLPCVLSPPFAQLDPVSAEKPAVPAMRFAPPVPIGEILACACRSRQFTVTPAVETHTKHHTPEMAQFAGSTARAEHFVHAMVAEMGTVGPVSHSQLPEASLYCKVMRKYPPESAVAVATRISQLMSTARG